MRFGRSGVVLLVALVATLLVSLARVRVARADGATPDGAWTMGPLSESFTVQQWSSACGPAPKSRTLFGGGPVTVQSDGAELMIAGGPRTLRTDACIDTLPTLARDAHSTDGRSWRTRCSTPPSDPRHAVVNAAYFLTNNDTLSIAETGRYEFTINDSRCVADVKRAASLQRAVAAAPPPAQSSKPSADPVVAAAPPLDTAAPPSQAPTVQARRPAHPDCGTPGDPARLEVRPSRKLLRLGDTFAFRAVVLDANGCPTGTPIQWAVGPVRFQDGATHAGQLAIDGQGKLSVPAADFADASFDVVASAAGKSARASVEAASPASYDALLAQSGLDANGEKDEPSVAILATSSIGASNVAAEDGARRRRLIFVAIVGGLAIALGIVAIIGVVRARKARSVERAAEARHAEKLREYDRQKQDREQKHAAQMRAHLESVARAQQTAAAAAARGVDSGPMFCPSCRREFTGTGPFCPFDSNRLVAVAGHGDILAGPAGRVCPTCGRGFNPGVKVCPHDGEELVPVEMAPARPPPVVAARGKICPTCGDRFEGNAAFCGKDGTQLVLLN